MSHDDIPIPSIHSRPLRSPVLRSPNTPERPGDRSLHSVVVEDSVHGEEMNSGRPIIELHSARDS
jgi:hypothetical protein